MQKKMEICGSSLWKPKEKNGMNTGVHKVEVTTVNNKNLISEILYFYINFRLMINKRFEKFSPQKVQEEITW